MGAALDKAAERVKEAIPGTKEVSRGGDQRPEGSPAGEAAFLHLPLLNPSINRSMRARPQKAPLWGPPPTPWGPLAEQAYEKVSTAPTEGVDCCMHSSHGAHCLMTSLSDHCCARVTNKEGSKEVSAARQPQQSTFFSQGTPPGVERLPMLVR